MGYVPVAEREFENAKDQLWDKVMECDWDGYFQLKQSTLINLKSKKKTRPYAEKLKGWLEHWEEHPTFGESRAYHEAYCKRRARESEIQYENEMRSHALHGQHHHYAICHFDGSVGFYPEYVELCKKLNVKLPTDWKG